MQKNQTIDERQQCIKDLQVLANEKNNFRNQLFKGYLRKKRFEPGLLSDKWKGMAVTAIRYVAPYSQQVSLEEFAYAASYQACSKDEPTLLQFGILSNSLEAVSIDQLGLANKEYVEFIEEAQRHINTYTERINHLRQQCDEETEKEFKRREAAIQNKLKDLQEKLKAEQEAQGSASQKNGLHPVIGEA